MGSFKNFIQESEDLLSIIYKLLDNLTEEEIDEFGYFLYTEFFEDDPKEDEEDDLFTLDDVKIMIKNLGTEMYEDIIYFLTPEEFDIEDGTYYIELDDIDDVKDIYSDNSVDEGVSRILIAKNYNRKKRKFMKLSKAALRKTVAIRKRKARKTLAKRKRYYRANKSKIASYQKSRARAMIKGKHFKKLRKRSG